MVILSILLALIVFSILVFIHEFGHFLLAKKNGVKVIEFSIGFGPRLFSFDKGETKYSFKIIPFGGACQMLNKDMISEEEMKKDKISDEEMERDKIFDVKMEKEDLSRSFESKSVWARMSIVLAGPIFNFILAFVLAIIVIGTVGYDKPVVTNVGEGSSAMEAGLKEGDIITEYNGTDITISRQIVLEDFVNPLSDKPVQIKYERDGKEYETTITPEYIERYIIGFSYSMTKEEVKLSKLVEGGPLANAGVKEGDIIVGINGTKISNGEELNEYFTKNPLTGENVTVTVSRDGKEEDYSVTPMVTGSYSLGFNYNEGRVKTSAPGVLKYSCVEVGYQISTVFKSLGMLFTGQVTVKDFSGPVGIVDYIDTAYKESKPDGALYIFLNIANLTMLLSANLGVMNLLPIPGLDGGRFLFQVIEVIFRRPVKHEEYFHLAGMILLMIFAMFILFQDIFKLF